MRSQFVMCAEGAVNWTDQSFAFGDDDRPVVTRQQAVKKFAWFTRNFLTEGSGHLVRKHRCRTRTLGVPCVDL